jgi:hypothetical protein
LTYFDFRIKISDKLPYGKLRGIQRILSMFNISRTLLVYILIGAILSIPFATTAFAEENLDTPSTFNSFIDAVVLRPLGLCAIPIGFGAFIIALPFSALGGNTQASFDKLVKAPAKYTFERPLGDFD